MNIFVMLLLCASSMLSGMSFQQGEGSLVAQNAAAFEFQAMKDKLQKSLERFHEMETSTLLRRHESELNRILQKKLLKEANKANEALNKLQKKHAEECRKLNEQQQQDVIQHGKLQTLDAVKYVLNMVDTKIAVLTKTTKSDSFKKNRACGSVRWIDLTLPVREASKNGTNISFEKKVIMDKHLLERQRNLIDLTGLDIGSSDVINRDHAAFPSPLYTDSQVAKRSRITWCDESNIFSDNRSKTYNRHDDLEELNAEAVDILHNLLVSPVKDSPYKEKQAESSSAVNHLLVACLFPIDSNMVDSVPVACAETTTTTTTLPSSPTRTLPVPELLLISPEKAARKRTGSPVGHSKKRPRLEYDEDDEDLFFDEDDFTRYD